MVISRAPSRIIGGGRGWGWSCEGGPAVLMPNADERGWRRWLLVPGLALLAAVVVAAVLSDYSPKGPRLTLPSNGSDPLFRSSPDGSTLLVREPDVRSSDVLPSEGTYSLWDTATGQRLGEWTCPYGRFAFTADRRLAVGNRQG